MTVRDREVTYVFTPNTLPGGLFHWCEIKESFRCIFYLVRCLVRRLFLNLSIPLFVTAFLVL